MKMEAEIGVMTLQAREYLRLPARHQKLRESPGTDAPLQLSEGTSLANTLVLDFWLPEPWDMDVLLLEEMTAIACPGCGASIWQQF